MNDKTVIAYWYCMSSKRRYDIVIALGDKGYLTPTNISKETGIRVNHISNLLSELKKYDIVVCINEEMRKGKLYRLTDFGKDLLLYLNGTKSIS